MLTIMPQTHVVKRSFHVFPDFARTFDDRRHFDVSNSRAKMLRRFKNKNGIRKGLSFFEHMCKF